MLKLLVLMLTCIGIPVVLGIAVMVTVRLTGNTPVDSYGVGLTVTIITLFMVCIAAAVKFDRDRWS